MIVTFEAELWIWDARRADTWTFVSLPEDVSEEIRDRTAQPRRGFGSVRARVTIGGSRWTTSIFPSAETGTYVLPVKRSVRQTESLDAGDIARVRVELLDLG